MKNHKDAVAEKSITDNPLNFEKRKTVKLAAALTLLGMGLGVNLEEAQAGMEKVLATKDQIQVSKPPVSYGKIKTQKPAVALDKAGILNPSVTQDKTGSKKPSVDYWKIETPARPSVTRVKPVPAATQKLPVEIEAKKIITPNK